MIQKRLAIFLLILLFIGTGGYFLIQFAKGYRFSFDQKTFQPTGLLVATSTPDGAQIFIDGQLKSATNTTLYLPPGTYQVELKKDGFHSWKKDLKVEKEMVSRTDAWLFPLVPDFRGSTYTGAASPLLSPDGSKIAYTVDGKIPEKEGLWVMDLADMPFGISRESRQIAKSLPNSRDISQTTYVWSPDSRQILITFQEAKIQENYLLDSNILNIPSAMIDITRNLEVIRKQWDIEKQLKQNQKLSKLPKELTNILEQNTYNIIFSPDETKILYTASASASIPDKLIPPIPSFSNQPQERQLKLGQIYIYDIKEDRNFLISTSTCAVDPILPTSTQTSTAKTKKSSQEPDCILYWLPTSRHVIFVEKNKVSIMEYEGTNLTAIFEGSYQFPFAFPHPSTNRILILTALGNAPDGVPNLYSVSLR